MSEVINRCINCPRNLNNRFVGRILNKLVKRDDPNIYCNGPEKMALAGSLEANYKKGNVLLGVMAENICGKDITPERREKSDLLLKTIFEQASRAQTEIINSRLDNEDSQNQSTIDTQVIDIQDQTGD